MNTRSDKSIEYLCLPSHCLVPKCARDVLRAPGAPCMVLRIRNPLFIIIPLVIPGLVYIRLPLRYANLLHYTPPFASILCSTLPGPSTVLYAALLYSTLVYATLHYSPLLYDTLRCSTVP